MATNGAPILAKPRFTPTEAASIYADLRQKVTSQGILKRSYGYYFFTSVLTIAAAVLSIYFVIISPTIWHLVAWTIVFIFLSIQLAGFFHDAGHRAVFNSPFLNDLYGAFIASLSNISYFYWRTKHNKHHASPNELEEDPDIEIPFVNFTHEKKLANPIERFVRPYQAYLYFPIGIFALIYFKFRSLNHYKTSPGAYLLWEIPIFVIGLFVWYALPFLLLPLSWALVFIILSNLGIGFYMMNIFAPNHKGMPQIEKGAKFSFLEQQIITSRNVKSNWLLDIFLIGLNYQIEHHLFPNCPRNKLAQITPYVLEICDKYEIDYSEVSLVETNRIILTELNQIAHS